VQPPLGEHKDYLACVAEWPIQAHPEAFGLHENADITCAQNEVKDLFETVLSLQARVSTGAGKSREDVIDEAAETLLNKTPAQVEILKSP
jgi:dynein heavy chain